MVPVMFWSMILNKTKYSASEYLSVLCITVGTAVAPWTCAPVL